MFQPQPTPFASFYSAGFADDTIPGYSSSPYQQGPLGGPRPGPGGGPGPGDANGGGHGHGHGHGQGLQGLGAHQQQQHGGAPPSGGAPLSIYPFSSLNLGPAATSQDLFNNQQPFSPLNNPLDSSFKMESGGHDLAAQEAAAREFKPQLEGPCVGEKITSNAITQEYAKADPVYVAKTLALPETYSHYRPIQGDGNCGWRAIAFSYFELLIHRGNKDFVDQEYQRLHQLNQYLVEVGGYTEWSFEDLVQDTFDLMSEISSNLANPDAAMAILTNKLKDRDTSNGIIYHLRLLAASWLKGNAAQYEGFLDEGGVRGYCLGVIEPTDREIEQVGINLLVEVLLKPVGFVIEIAYLDRSPGSEVNTYRFPMDAPDPDPSAPESFIYLLFRPDHYDILYKPSRTPAVFQPQPQQLDLQVHRVSYEEPSFSQSDGFSVAPSQSMYSTDNMSLLAMLPGSSGGGGLGALGGLGGSFGGSLGGSTIGGSLGGSTFGDYSPSPQSPWMPSPFAEAPLVLRPAPPQQQPAPPPTPLPSQPAPQAVSPTTTHSIRFSGYQWQQPPNSWPEQTFQTNTFKNSHFNTAHFNNPNFQPEEYRPGADDGDVRCERPARKGSRGKASVHSNDHGSPYSDTKSEN